jgi:ribosomal protein S3
MVHLRRPGLLIGKGGRTINALAEYLDCKIDIVEVDLYKQA